MTVTQQLQLVVPNHAPVPATSAAVTTTFTSGLFMEPGVVQYNSERFDVTEQGLLSILAYAPSAYGYTPYIDAGYRIVKKAAQLDHYAILAALGAQIQYGSEDEALTVAQRIAAMKSRKLRMRCGPTIQTVREALASIGVTMRQVHLLTADEPTNMDDGHVAMEVLIDGEWRFFDVAGDSYFAAGGEHLSLAGLIETGVTNAEHVRLARTEVGAGGSSEIARLLSAVYDQRLSSDALYREWCARIFQIPGILDTDGLIYFYMPPGTEHRQSWLLGLSSQYRVLSKPDWQSSYYDW